MEKQVKDELKQLCQSIIKSSDEPDLTDLLTQARVLYEKLLVLNFLYIQKSTQANDKHEEPAERTFSHEVVMENKDDLKPVVSKKTSLNSKLGMGSIDMGFNDRISFVKHLFSSQQEDFNRVLSQLNTFESFTQAESFIEQIVKPDYNWHQKEEYEIRFMELIRRRFGKE